MSATKKQTPPAAVGQPAPDGQAVGHWITAAVLRALATIAPTTGSTFTAAKLAAALPKDAQRRIPHATRRLVAAGFATFAKRAKPDGTVAGLYTVTAEGAAAIEAAAGGAVLKGGGGGPLHPAEPGSMRARLWHLVRVRRTLEADEAARLLCDAGLPEVTYLSRRAKINGFLSRWEFAGVLQLSAAKLPHGRKRYVLVNDPGPTVPAFKHRPRQVGKGAK